MIDDGSRAARRVPEDGDELRVGRSYAVFDDELDVALEAAIGYAVQVLEQDRLASVTPPLRERLAHLVAEARGQHVDEVVDLLRRLGAK